ncbi:MAG: HD-GYP domain-containing protein [Chloroflexi bacterium]|nr:HD-GYP domain-containing protein [Chloroflexota bacterium]
MGHALRQGLARLTPQPAVGSALAGGGLVSVSVAWLRPTTRPMPLSADLLAVLLAGALVAAYYHPIHVRHQTKVALVSVVYYLLAILVPPPLAALTAGLGALAGEVTRRRLSGAYLSDIAAEVGRRLLMVLVGGLIAHVGVGFSSAPSSVGLVAAALALGVLDALSLPLVLAPIAGEPPRQVLVASVRETALPEGVQYAVGIVGADAALRHLWTLGLLVVPCAVVLTAFKVMNEMHDGTRQLLENMADAVDLRDPYTGGHSRRVTEYSAAILRALGLNGPEIDLIVTAARVHDIGKIGTPDAVLNKPGQLTPEERALMEQHPVQGAELLKRYRDFARGVALVRHHHESWDGTGYPDGLAGAAIPFGARVIAVADSYDAMTSDRPYRAGMPVAKAAAILRAGRDQQWDATIVDAFLCTLSREDVGASPAPFADRTEEGDRGVEERALAHTA